MELDELKLAWRGLSAKMDEQTVELHLLRRANAMDRLRARLRMTAVGQWLQLAIGLLVVSWAGGYWWDHLGQTHLLVYGLALHLYGIALLAAAALQLTRLMRLDYHGPVLEVQRGVLALRRLRVACERMLLAFGFIAWVPLVFMALRAAGMDVWLSRPGVVIANLAFGAILAGLAYGWSVRFRGAFESGAAGRSLVQAETELAELAQSP